MQRKFDMFRTLVLALLLATSAQAGGLFTSTYSGNWRGVGIQSDGSDWDMQLTLGPTLGVVRYPRLQCGGNWQYTAVETNSLSGVETIDFGLENCIETGMVYLQPYGENQMIYLWCGEEDGVSAVAVLARDGFFPADYGAERAASFAALKTLGSALKNITCTGNRWLGV